MIDIIKYSKAMVRLWAHGGGQGRAEARSTPGALSALSLGLSCTVGL